MSNLFPARADRARRMAAVGAYRKSFFPPPIWRDMPTAIRR